ncbi:SGNH/GDSL hydrolase family protein [Patescibacteria group bacterium]|nr:SGNH/GDSL hydrolase family protein [Patescibacteria group bacterium]
MTTIVCIGDSIVEGEGDELGLSGWAGRLQQKILKNSKVGKNRVYNLGMGIETSLDLLHRFFSEVLYRNPDVIILQTSHGDSRSTLNNENEEEFEIGKSARMRVYHKLFDYLSKSEKKVLVLGLNPVSLHTKFEKALPQRAERIESHNEGLKKMCDQYDLPFFDPRDIFKNKNLEDYYVDGLHPNSKGYDLMFEKIFSKLLELKYL